MLFIAHYSNYPDPTAAEACLTSSVHAEAVANPPNCCPPAPDPLDQKMVIIRPLYDPPLSNSAGGRDAVGREQR